MLYLVNAPDIRLLVGELASVLGDPLPDPMMSDWIAVPTAGMQRWTKLELARSLGATKGHEDGVTANVEFAFPGRLRQLILEADPAIANDPANDPWQIDHLVWAVLEVLESAPRSNELDVMPSLAKGATPYARARRIADLFDRYSLHRPELIRSWSQGRDVDSTGNRLPEHLVWQPILWRLVRDRVGMTSPPERLHDLLWEVKEGRLDIDLPPRLSVFGVTTLPGGWLFLDLVHALAVHREVYCFFLDPSPRATDHARTAVKSMARDPLLYRSRDEAYGVLEHPLLISWGRLFQERATILESAAQKGLISKTFEIPATTNLAWLFPTTLLSKVQHDLRFDHAPSGDHGLLAGDRSIEVHKCHGQVRQVEVLRDAILHLLEDDPTLVEEDIVVLCPAIRDFAPLVEAVFGVSASEVTRDPESHALGSGPGTPRLSYRIVDRSLRSLSPVIDALDSLLSLASGRCSATEVLEFLALPSVRLRYGFDEQALDTIAYWVETTMVRWGLSAEHREANGFSEHLSLNTWRAAFDRLLLGIAMRDSESGIAPGAIVPFDVEGDEIQLAGHLVDLMTRVERVASVFLQSRSPRQWCDELIRISEELFATEYEQRWQLDRLRAVFKEIADSAVIGGQDADVELSLSEIRRVLSDELHGQPGRPDFFRGGITVSSLTPLRWLPFRVVCLLGFDDVASTETGLNGDDVTLLAPRLGDPDPRSEARQSLLEAVLSADERLIITVTAHDERSNLPVVPSVAFSEFRETVLNTMAPSSRVSWQLECEVTHPRQPYDDRNFEPGQLGHANSWSFDSVAFTGAKARRQQQSTAERFLSHPISISDDERAAFSVDDLRNFLEHPVRRFMKRRLAIYRPFDEPPRKDELLIDLEGLESAAIGRRFLSARLAEGEGEWETHNDLWWRRELARGSLPVGGLAIPTRKEIEDSTSMMFESMQLIGITSDTARERVPIAITEQDRDLGTCTISGFLEVGHFLDSSGHNWSGTTKVAYARPRPSHELVAWLDLVLLTIFEPSISWHAVVIRRCKRATTKGGFIDLKLEGATTTERTTNAKLGLEVILRCAQLGLTEPLPLFPKLSQVLYRRKANEADWITTSRPRSGEGIDQDNVLAFGRLDLTELLSLPAHDSDPGTGPFRAERLARFLWGAFYQTVNMNDQVPSPTETTVGRQ